MYGKEESALICHKCGSMLTPGEGSFYVVKIEAMCDPTPPDVWSGEKMESIQADIELLMAQMSEMSEQELMDQVYRKLTILLCAACYSPWIENPSG